MVQSIILRFLTLALLILAIARPQTGTGEDKTTRHVLDIMIALDVSGSMAADDAGAVCEAGSGI